MEHFNKLTPAEDERLALLLEECGEVIQIIGKIQRHGYESYNPLDPIDERKSNRYLLQTELGDLLASINLMESASDIYWSNLQYHAWKKKDRVKKYLHHQGEQ